MNHYDKQLLEYYTLQGADQQQLNHIFNQQQYWK